MDVQDHKKTPSSGNESHGVHVCHKCGWPFPNPHPSAKHRRAHKRVCGKIEGYKLIESENQHISDDDHLSDDDMKTPSPKIEKGSVKELGSSDGIGLKSIKSEDDVFSDAVTEFSDSGVSPSMEERLESVRELDKNVGKELVHDANENQLSEGNEISDMTKAVHDLTAGCKVFDAEAVGSLMNQLTIIKPVSDIKVEEVSSGIDPTGGLQVNSCSIVSETISEDINTNSESEKQKELISSGQEKDTEVNESVNQVEPFAQSVDPLIYSVSEASLTESKTADAEEADIKSSSTVTLGPELHEADGNISRDMAVEEKEDLNGKLQAEMENVNLEPILHEADGKVGTVCTVTEVVKQEKELIDVSEDEKTKHDLSPQIEPLKCADASATSLIEADSAKDTVKNGHDELAEVYDSKLGGDKETYSMSVAETLSAIENPEFMIREFKDPKIFKSNFPLDLGDAEVTSSVENDNKLTLPEPEPNSVSSVSDRRLHGSTSDCDPSDHCLEKEDGLAPVTGEVDTSGSRVISGEASGTNYLEGSPESSGFETQKSQTNYILEGFQHHAAGEVSLQNGVPAASTMANSDVISAGSSIDEETCADTNKSSTVEGAGDSVIRKSDPIGIENGTSHSLDENNNSSSQKSTGEVYAEASRGLEVGNTNEVLKSGTALCAVSELNPKDHSVASDKQSEKSDATEAQRLIAVLGTVTIPDAVSDKNSEDSCSDQPAAFPLAAGISSQSSAADEAGNTRNALISEALLDEVGGKLMEEQFNVSAANNSVNSSCRTESLDGNWGSASVLSTQTDGTAPADTEMLSSTGSQAPEKSESTLLKPETAVGNSRHENPDAFEPPSFQTLVESGVADKKVAASETNTVQKDEQPSEALRAGWFPSLTNVVNESEGRKKNEEIIAKVTNWSTGKQHSPLKNLLNEAHAETKVKAADQKQVPDVNQADETAPKKNGAAVTTVSSIMGSETPNNNAAKREVEKEWNSPARYPVEIKKEKKKGKPYWVPFVCCTSVHQDM